MDAYTQFMLSLPEAVQAIYIILVVGVLSGIIPLLVLAFSGYGQRSH